MEKNKILTLSISIILIFIIGTVFIYWQQNTQNTRKKVLGSLKENLEFCQILKDKINVFSQQGEFWLICNGRPFYTVYENGEVKTELNGWSFLKKEPDLWNELKDCDFYDSRGSELIFYCPRDFYSSSLTAKSFKFDENSLKMKKLEEKNFLEIIGEDIVAIYDFLSKCKIGSFDITQYGDYPVVLWLTFNCKEGDYVVATDLATVPLQPPILLGDLSYEERARISFEKSFGFSIDNIETRANQVLIDSNNFGVRYIFSTYKPRINYNLKGVSNENDAKVRIGELGKYFIFPPIEKIETIDFIQEIYEGVLTFKINNKHIISVSWAKPIRAINAFWKKTEGINR